MPGYLFHHYKPNLRVAPTVISEIVDINFVAWMLAYNVGLILGKPSPVLQGQRVIHWQAGSNLFSQAGLTALF